MSIIRRLASLPPQPSGGSRIRILPGGPHARTRYGARCSRPTQAAASSSPTIRSVSGFQVSLRPRRSEMLVR